MPLLLAALLAQAATAAPAPGSMPDQLAALYDEVCLRTFPYDAAVDELMKRKAAIPLTPAEVKTTLRDDPGRGWRLPGPDGRSISIFIELPPYHACSVRAGIGTAPLDLAAYRRAVAAFEETRPGFAAQKPADMTVESIRIRAIQEVRPLPGGHESLLVITQQLTDPVRIAKGEGGTELRFVHQIVTTR
ncbi:hypothetical protein GGQ80_000753 [Sphingomonas jinjuensis]|uniref:Uncharacterized protein n=1 Tax=Sphingomonas jinjuensis TaxID=535907 RepID=A0A840FHN7_9SPHN|nr:hypothetical protein [Sphingomonas jinjuensis]MBB4152865.1 hypothetical protein [Sphingomonas jinjuensis]